jgi:hypothetical protein
MQGGKEMFAKPKQPVRLRRRKKMLRQITLRNEFPCKKAKEIEVKAELSAKVAYYNRYSDSLMVETNRTLTEEDIRAIRKVRRDRRYYLKHKADILAKKERKYWRARLGKATALNEHFTGSDGHHINADTVVYIPKELHQKYRHSLKTNLQMETINKAVVDWLHVEQKYDVADMVKEHLTFSP